MTSLFGISMGVITQVVLGAFVVITAVVAVLGADDPARRLLLVGSQDLVLAIILSDHVEHVGQPVVVVMTDIRTEQCLRDGRDGEGRL